MSQSSQPTRPPSFSYDFRRIKEFPRRLLFPPDAGVGCVRSLKVVPRYEVTLYDVLDGKHLPPLTLKDFEDYLVFESHSAENLYFIFWLRDYTAKFAEWEHAQSELPENERSPANSELTLSFSRARGTFFDPSSHLELNLPGEMVDNLLQNSKHLSHPTPAMLKEIQRHVEEMLRESLTKFVCSSCRNSGRRRGMFAIAVGLITMLVGLAPVLMSVYHREPRAVRVASLFPFWFGATTAIAGFHGICVVIFLFGDARQLYPYELARPTLTAVPLSPPLELPLPVSAHRDRKSIISSNEDTDHDQDRSSKIGYSWNDPEPVSHPVIPYPPSPYTDSLPETAGFIRPDNASSGRSSVTVVFDFDALPRPPPKSGAESMRSSWVERNMFQGLTKVASPMVTRAQWEIVARSATMGALVALLLEAIVLSVPGRD